MIKATELRLGNLVKDIPGFDLIFPIEGRHLYASVDNNGFLRFRPISLNMDWLNRMGFELQDKEIDDAPGDGWWGIPIIRHTLQITTSTKYHMVNIVEESGNSVLFRKFIGFQYVHQIQNLYFALTGEDLLIKSI